MSAFSDVINEFLQEKEITVFSLAKYCDTDRSTMYKILNGKRKAPSPEMFQKIIEFMHLTPLEQLRLEEAWKISRLSPEVYYKRKSVENFINKFPVPSAAALPELPFIPVNINNQYISSEVSALTSQQQINFCLHRILLSEASKESGKIGLFLQPDHTFLFDLLSSLQPVGKLSIQHIICFTQKDRFTKEHELYNLLCFRELIPLYLAGLDYLPRFFYDNIQSHYMNFNMYPCLILTSQSAVMCSSDFQSGILYRKSTIVNLLWKQFLTYYDQCSSLFKTALSDPERPDLFFEMLVDTETKDKTLSIQPEACLAPFYTRQILKDISNPDIPHLDSILSQACLNAETNKKKLQTGQFLLYFTLEGISHFARTGLIEEIPSSFYKPFSQEHRLYLLQEVKNHCLSGAYRILTKPSNYISSNLRLFLRNKQCHILFKNNHDQTILFRILEPSFLNLFQDYLENLEPGCYYPREEAADLIQELIDQLQKKEL